MCSMIICWWRNASSDIECPLNAPFSHAAGIVGISVAILVVLFFSQHVGTQRIAFLFSPVMIVWYFSNLGIAIYNLSFWGTSVFQVSAGATKNLKYPFVVANLLLLERMSISMSIHFCSHTILHTSTPSLLNMMWHCMPNRLWVHSGL